MIYFGKKRKQNGILNNILCNAPISSMKQNLISNDVEKLGGLEAQESNAN